MWHLQSWGQEVQLPGLIMNNLGQRKGKRWDDLRRSALLADPRNMGWYSCWGPQKKSCGKASLCIKWVLFDGTLNPSGDCEIIQGGELRLLLPVRYHSTSMTPFTKSRCYHWVNNVSEVNVRQGKGEFSEKDTHLASPRMVKSKKAMRTFGKYFTTALRSSTVPCFLFEWTRLREVKPKACTNGSEGECWLSAKPQNPKHQRVSLELEQVNTVLKLLLSVCLSGFVLCPDFSALTG